MTGPREDGSSPIVAVFGVAMFLSFMLFTVQILLHLYATSAVSAAAYDAARSMAAEDGRTCQQARATARDLLGSYGQSIAVDCVPSGEDHTVVRIVGPSPAPLVDGFFGGRLDLGTIERDARVRTERFRAG